MWFQELNLIISPKYMYFLHVSIFRKANLQVLKAYAVVFSLLILANRYVRKDACRVLSVFERLSYRRDFLDYILISFETHSEFSECVSNEVKARSEGWGQKNLEIQPRVRETKRIKQVIKGEKK